MSSTGATGLKVQQQLPANHPEMVVVDTEQKTTATSERKQKYQGLEDQLVPDGDRSLGSCNPNEYHIYYHLCLYFCVGV